VNKTLTITLNCLLIISSFANQLIAKNNEESNMKKNYPGILICIEGIDGSGKSTLAQELKKELEKKHTVTLTKEPGATEFGQCIRKITQNKDIPLSPKAEYLLFTADRADHIDTVVRPALQKGHVVISDRMIDSSVAYQGYGRGTSIEMINTINKWTLDDVWPTVTLFVDVPLEVAIERITKRAEKQTRYEAEKKDFMQRVRDGFHTIYKTRNDVHTIDGTQKIHDVVQDALAIIKNYGI
jgi:dTMP kinase